MVDQLYCWDYKKDQPHDPLCQKVHTAIEGDGGKVIFQGDGYASLYPECLKGVGL